MLFRSWSIPVYAALAAMLSTSLPAMAQQAPAFALKDGDRVLFYGDSITAQRLYPRLVEDLVLTRYPHLKVRFYNAGMGGDKVTGGGAGPIDLRLSRDVFPLKPTVVTVMLGMNDGNYGNGDPQKNEQTYEAGYRHIVQRLRETLPDARLYLIRPSPYDEVAHAPGVAGYNATLIRYGEIDAQIAKEFHAEVIDANAPVVAELKQYLAYDPKVAAGLIPDRIHPQLLAAWGMAAAIAEAWHLQPIVSDVKLDAKSGRGSTVGATVSNGILGHDGVFSWTQTDDSLPLAVNPDDANQKLLLKFTDLGKLDVERLRVTSLAAGSYDLTIDALKVANFTSEQLAAGIDLNLYKTPMIQAAVVADRAADEHAGIDNSRFSMLIGDKGAKRDAGVDAMAEWRDMKYDAELPLFLPKPHTFKLTPAAAPQAMK